MQIENVFKFAMLFIRRFSLFDLFCVLYCVSAFLFIFFLEVNSKTIYWFDLHSFRNRFCIFAFSFTLVIQLFFSVWSLIVIVCNFLCELVWIEQRNWVDIFRLCRFFFLFFNSCMQTDVAKLLLKLRKYTCTKKKILLLWNFFLYPFCFPISQTNNKLATTTKRLLQNSKMEE